MLWNGGLIWLGICTDIDLDSVGGGRSGTLKPALGFKVGYIFEGFWAVKEKKED